MPYAPSPRYWLGSSRPILPDPFDNRHNFLDRAKESARTEQPYILIGEAGRGKTSLMALTASRIKDAQGAAISTRIGQPWLDHRVRWAQAHELYVDILAEIDFRRRHFDFTEYYSASGIASRVACLFIDDIGTEPKTPSAVETMQSLIDARYRAKLPTWFTTNLDMDAFSARYGTRTMSRVFGTIPSYTIVGDDRRLTAMGIKQ
jgi:DNA replication protein DnaC